jgi:hypothetical protein
VSAPAEDEQRDIVGKVGDATILVFRVHGRGRPERVPVE